MRNGWIEAARLKNLHLVANGLARIACLRDGRISVELNAQVDAVASVDRREKSNGGTAKGEEHARAGIGGRVDRPVEEDAARVAHTETPWTLSSASIDSWNCTGPGRMGLNQCRQPSQAACLRASGRPGWSITHRRSPETCHRRPSSGQTSQLPRQRGNERSRWEIEHASTPSFHAPSKRPDQPESVQSESTRDAGRPATRR